MGNEGHKALVEQSSCGLVVQPKLSSLFVNVTLIFAVRKRKGGNIPSLVAGVLSKEKGATPNPKRDYWLLWDLTAQQSQAVEGH